MNRVFLAELLVSELVKMWTTYQVAKDLSGSWILSWLLFKRICYVLV